MLQPWREIRFWVGNRLSPMTILRWLCGAPAGRNKAAVTLLKTTAARSFVLRLATALAIVICCAVLARAGGPKYVAGSSYFNSSTMGQPLTWSLGQVSYYTDQGDLSPILPSAAANALVGDAF